MSYHHLNFQNSPFYDNNNGNNNLNLQNSPFNDNNNNNLNLQNLSFNDNNLNKNNNNLKIQNSPFNHSKFLFQDSQTPSTNCPHCGQEQVRIKGIPYLTCTNQYQPHKFYDCPVCLDTRISEIRENVYYCGLHHPYHLCPIHHTPVIGPSTFRIDVCTCSNNHSSVLTTSTVQDWKVPFL